MASWPFINYPNYKRLKHLRMLTYWRLQSYTNVYDPSVVNGDTFFKNVLTPILQGYSPNSSLIRTKGYAKVFWDYCLIKKKIVPTVRSMPQKVASNGLIPTRTADAPTTLFTPATVPKVNCFACWSVNLRAPTIVTILSNLQIAWDKWWNMVLTSLTWRYVRLLRKVSFYLSKNVSIWLATSEGHFCRVLAMDLKNHGMYRLMEFGNFFLPQSIKNLDTFTGTFQVMNHLQVSMRIVL